MRCSLVNKLLNEAKVVYYSNKIASSGIDKKSLFKITNYLLGATSESTLGLLSTTSSRKLAQNFSDFFSANSNVLKVILQTPKTSVCITYESYQQSSATNMIDFSHVSDSDIRRIIQKSPNKSCELDPIPSNCNFLLGC